MFRKNIHVCVMNRNVGDNALNLAIRTLLRPRFYLSHMELLNNQFGPKEMRTLKRAQRVIFGGGGLIHSYNPHGVPFERTGTMWNIRLKDLEQITVPITLYGVGFNHFHGEPAPHPAMRTFFKTLVAKNALISLRNDGSVERLTQHFPELADRVTEIPDPGIFFRPRPRHFQTPHVVLQLAADRPSMRYADRRDEFEAVIRALCDHIKEDILLVPHTVDDAAWYQEISPQLPSHVRIWPHRKRARHTAEVIGLYAGARFTISTRGHSQICSVGNGVPTFSISTHPKVSAFAQSCGIQDHCVEWHKTDHRQVIERFERFLADMDRQRTHLRCLNEEFDKRIATFNESIA